MRIAFALVAVAVLCPSLASAQPVKSVTIRLVHDDDDSVINVGETVTWTLWVEFEGYEDWQWLQFAQMSLDANEDLLSVSEPVFDPYPRMAHGGPSSPSISESAISGSSFTQLLYEKYICDVAYCTPIHTGSPIAVVQFDARAVEAGEFAYTIGELTTGVRTAGFIDIATSAFTFDEYAPADTTILTDSLTIIPTPPAALFFLAALGLKTRRRRA